MAVEGFSILVTCGDFQGLYYGSGELDEALEEVTANFGTELAALASGPSDLLFEVRGGSFAAVRRAGCLLREQSPAWADALAAFRALEFEGSGTVAAGFADEAESHGGSGTDGTIHQRMAAAAAPGTAAKEPSLGRRRARLLLRASWRED